MKASIVVGGTLVWAASAVGVVAYHIPYYSSAVSRIYRNNWTSPITRSLHHVQVLPEHRGQEEETSESLPEDYSLEELFPSVDSGDQESTTEADGENAGDDDTSSEQGEEVTLSESASNISQNDEATTSTESEPGSATPPSVAASTTAGAETAVQTSVSSPLSSSIDLAATTPMTIFLSSEDGAEVVTVLTPSGGPDAAPAPIMTAKVSPSWPTGAGQISHSVPTESTQHHTTITVVTSPFATTQTMHNTTTATKTVVVTDCAKTMINEGLCSSTVFDGQVYGAAPTVGPGALLYGGGMLLKAALGAAAFI